MLTSTNCSGHDRSQRELWVSDRTLTTIAYLLFLGAALCDVCSPTVTFVGLFSISLLLLASRARNADQVWKYVFFFIAATFVLYFVKYGLVLKDQNVPLVSFRLYNRTLAAVSFGLLGIAVQAWLYWQHERSLLDYFERRDEDEINATVGMIGSVSLGLIIMAIDCITPLGYNLPILFAVPLYLSSWTGDRRALWITTGTLIGMIVVGYFIYPSMVQPGLQPYSAANRVVSSVMLILLAIVLQTRTERAETNSWI